jgi:uncharacterized cupin superfamily protein
MVIKDVPYELIDWQAIDKTEVKGITGKAFWQTRKFSDIRLRIIEKLPGYRADHFCKKGHIIHILEGEMVIELENGESFPVKAGQTVLLGDDPEFAHSTYTENGVKYFIID